MVIIHCGARYLRESAQPNNTANKEYDLHWLTTRDLRRWDFFIRYYQTERWRLHARKGQVHSKMKGRNCCDHVESSKQFFIYFLRVLFLFFMFTCCSCLQVADGGLFAVAYGWLKGSVLCILIFFLSIFFFLILILFF